jgi:hypothetical protein
MLADLRLAFHSLRRSPVFSIAAITTLALGIAASTAIFSLFYQILLRSLPVPSSEQLVSVHYNPPQLAGRLRRQFGGSFFESDVPRVARRPAE